MLRFTTIITCMNTPTKHSSILPMLASLVSRQHYTPDDLQIQLHATTCNTNKSRNLRFQRASHCQSFPLLFSVTMGSLFIKPKQHDLQYLQVTSDVTSNTVSCFLMFFQNGSFVVFFPIFMTCSLELYNCFFFVFSTQHVKVHNKNPVPEHNTHRSPYACIDCQEATLH